MTDWKKRRNPQPTIIKNKEPWNTQAKTECFYRIPLLRAQAILRRGGRKSIRDRGDGDIKKMRTFKSINQHT